MNAKLPGGLGPRLLALLLGGLTTTLYSDALAHAGGIVVRPVFTGPSGLIEAQGGVIDITWEDMVMDISSYYEIKHRRGHAVPVSTPPPDQVEGTLIAEVAVADSANLLAWDTAAVPAGAWSMVFTSLDPPLCGEHTFVDAVFVVREEGQPAPLGGWFHTPQGSAETVERESR
ncbi:MAG: hypothetical protein O2894_13815 [Planctomycetota bacterium]|nr:hypothetical protein [Planctomycetota bacterium]